MAVCALVAFVGLVWLGVWQIERRAWKHAMTERVEQRVHAEPVEVPPPYRWAGLTAADDEYRRVKVSGVLLHDKETLVQATTALGAGFWVLTPLRSADATVVWINRGFVPSELRARAARQASDPVGTVSIVGLLRLPEPGGAFLRHNDPAAGRWYSRDVAAIAAQQGLSRTTPYFIDAEATPASGAAATERTWPAAGLTVVVFPDNHLVYALTWWALAAMVAAATVYVVRDERRVRAASVHGAGAAKGQESAPC